MIRNLVSGRSRRRVTLDILIDPFTTVANTLGGIFSTIATLRCLTVCLAVKIFISADCVGVSHIAIIVNEVTCSTYRITNISWNVHSRWERY